VNLPIEYSDKPVTPFGGMALMKRFIDQVGIREYLGELDLPQPGSNRGYTSVEIVESFWLKHLDGCEPLCALQLAQAGRGDQRDFRVP